MTESQTQREFVESKWAEAFMRKGMFNDGGDAFCFVLNGEARHSNWHTTEPEAWQAAYDFTISHLKAIRQIEREIELQNLVRNHTSILQASDFTDIDSTLRRLEGIRDEMRRGLK